MSMTIADIMSDIGRYAVDHWYVVLALVIFFVWVWKTK